MLNIYLKKAKIRDCILKENKYKKFEIKNKKNILFHFAKYIPTAQHYISKNKTWKIEYKNLNFKAHLK
jgi:hypothetical protein